LDAVHKLHIRNTLNVSSLHPLPLSQTCVVVYTDIYGWRQYSKPPPHGIWHALPNQRKVDAYCARICRLKLHRLPHSPLNVVANNMASLCKSASAPVVLLHAEWVDRKRATPRHEWEGPPLMPRFRPHDHPQWLPDPLPMLKWLGSGPTTIRWVALPSECVAPVINALNGEVVRTKHGGAVELFIHVDHTFRQVEITLHSVCEKPMRIVEPWRDNDSDRVLGRCMVLGIGSLSVIHDRSLVF
jgi:hypothetical protein